MAKTLIEKCFLQIPPPTDMCAEIFRLYRWSSMHRPGSKDSHQQKEQKDEEKYLGDLISKDGRNLKKIKARVNKGKGIVQKTYLMEFHLENFISKLQFC